MTKVINTLSSIKDQLKWAAERGIFPHKYQGPIDCADCQVCGLSIDQAVHYETQNRS